MTILNKLYSLFLTEAKKSDINHQLAAGILIGSKLVSKKPYCNVINTKNNNSPSIHAEINALLQYYGNNIYFDNKTQQWKLSNKIKPKKIDLIVMRFNKNDYTVNARPCYHCLKMMKNIGINKVFYTIDNNIVSESVKNMISMQVSSVTRYLDLSRNGKSLNFINSCNYFENIIKTHFPKYIKEINLMYFLEYNFKNILPEYNFIIKNTKTNKIIVFYNKNKNILLESFIY